MNQPEIVEICQAWSNYWPGHSTSSREVHGGSDRDLVWRRRRKSWAWENQMVMCVTSGWDQKTTGNPSNQRPVISAWTLQTPHPFFLAVNQENPRNCVAVCWRSFFPHGRCFFVPFCVFSFLNCSILWYKIESERKVFSCLYFWFAFSVFVWRQACVGKCWSHGACSLLLMAPGCSPTKYCALLSDSYSFHVQFPTGCDAEMVCDHRWFRKFRNFWRIW